MPSLPRQILIEPRVEHHALSDPAGTLRQRLDATWQSEDWAGRRVVVGVGSRGIDRVAEMARTTVSWLRQQGADPIVMPAMGSHGGGTPEGQRELLASYGVTEHSVDAPIDASMDVAEVGQQVEGVRVVVSACALNADAVVLLNRIKPHTDFGSALTGSGLVKMSAIGLGKAEGAFRCHWAAATRGHERVLRAVSRVVLGHLPRVYGIGLVEDGSHRIALIEPMLGAEFFDREPELLAKARAWMPVLPFPEVDVLVVDEIGKDISGTGMDTNIVGRGVDLQPMPNRRSAVSAIYVRGLTPASHGNAIGIGMADIVSDRLVEAMDRHKTYTNAVSAMTPGTARVSIHFPTDRECLRAALRVSAADPAAPRIVRIRHTLALDRVVVSEAYADEIADRDDLTVLVPPTDWRFDDAGNFDPATDLLAGVLA
jgi:Lactate racemase N-terminal domain